MDGLDSGRVVWRLAVDQFRRLDIGELCDGGRITRQPTGQVVWYDDDGGLCAQLRYDFDRHKQDGKLYLMLSDTGRRPQAFEIDVCSGLATCALCFCGKAVRHLYTAPEDLFVSDVTPPFACRHYWGLIYRRPCNDDLEYVRRKAGPAIDAYADLPVRVRHRPWRHYVEEPPAELAAELAYELPLAPRSCASGLCACAPWGFPIARSLASRPLRRAPSPATVRRGGTGSTFRPSRANALRADPPCRLCQRTPARLSFRPTLRLRTLTFAISA